MRRLLLFALLATALTGCASRYSVSLSNGSQMVSRGRPKLVDGRYVFTDTAGQKQEIPSFRVNQIAPYSSSDKQSPFNNYGGK